MKDVNVFGKHGETFPSFVKAAEVVCVIIHKFSSAIICEVKLKNTTKKASSGPCFCVYCVYVYKH